jgi:hypothetical protein
LPRSTTAAAGWTLAAALSLALKSAVEERVQLRSGDLDWVGPAGAWTDSSRSRRSALGPVAQPDASVAVKMVLNVAAILA